MGKPALSPVTSLVAAVAAALLSGCYTLDERDVFRPPAVDGDRAEAMRGEAELGERFGAEVVHSRHDFGGLPVAVTVASVAGEGRPLIVSCSGNASDRYTSGTSYAAKILPHGDAVLWDYPGYGDSGGVAGVADVDAASRGLMAWVEREAQGRPVVLWGHSLGGFVCAQMAARADVVDAVVLETTARNVAEVGRAWTPRWMPVRVRAGRALAAYDTANALAEFAGAESTGKNGGKGKGKVLILGAGRDGVLPVELHRSLAEAIPNATYLEMAQATHYSAGFDPRAVRAVREMLDGL